MRRQTLRYGAAGVAGSILVVALVLMANWLGARHYQRWDWTSSRLYSLSDKSLNLVSALDQDVEVVVFMVPGGPLYDQVHELLSRYQAASDRITVEYIDPDKEPLRTTQLAERFGVGMADTVVFTVGDRTKYVTSEQMVDYDFSGMQFGQQPTVRAFKGEEQFTSAILSLVAPEVPKIYVVTGHGEASIEPAPGGGQAERSLSILAGALRRENMETESLSLLPGEIPEDAKVIIIAGPTRAYTESEIAALDAFLDRGGRLLVALDPLIEPDGSMRPTRLEAFLAEWGVTVGDDLVVDPSRKLPFFDLSAVYLTDFAEHPMTRGLDGIAVLFTVTRSLTGDSDDARVVVETTADGWGETDLGMLLRGEPVNFDQGSDTPGPAAVAVVVEGEAAAAEEADESAPGDAAATFRLAVFGDSDFLTDLDIANAGNQILAVNAVSWLAARELAMGIPPRDVEQLAFFLDRRQMQVIAVVALLVLPGAAIVAGVLVWRRRRH